MGHEEDTRPKITLSELIDMVIEFSKGKRHNYIQKIESVVMALASLEQSKLGAITNHIKNLKLNIGADAYKETKDILRFLREKNVVEKQGKIYRLTYRIVPLPHLKDLKEHSSKQVNHISSLFDRVTRLRLANFTLKEPKLALASISILTELRIYLGNLKSIVAEQSIILIQEAVQKIDEYQAILEKYHQEGEMPENEGSAFFGLEVLVTNLYSPQFEKIIRETGHFCISRIGKLDEVGKCLREAADG